MHGKVVRILADKGFGFIKADEDGKEYFFHHSSCYGGTFADLTVGARVTFEETDSGKGPRAEMVMLSEEGV